MDNEQQGEVSPQKKKQVETVNAALTQMIYDPKTKQSVQKMLKSGTPEMSIPKTVNTVFGRFEDMSTQKNGDMPMDMKLAAGVHCFEEICELGGMMGVIPQEMSPEQKQPLLKETMQQYIQKGIKDGSLDPIELQQEIEPLLSEGEKAIGDELAGRHGTPLKPTQQQLTDSLTSERMRPMQVENAQLKKQLQSMQGALQGVANGGGQ